MGRIIVCRHGNTFDKGDVVTRVGGRTDLPLSRSGQEQADALSAATFADTSFRAAYCSSLQRTRQTAAAILGARAGWSGPATLPFLTEIDYGPDENVAEDKVVARIGEDALRAWEEDSRVPDGWTRRQARHSFRMESATRRSLPPAEGSDHPRGHQQWHRPVPAGCRGRCTGRACSRNSRPVPGASSHCNAGTRIVAWNQPDLIRRPDQAASRSPLSSSSHRGRQSAG
jgi:hypothetical protein